MPTSVSLTPHFQKLIKQLVAEGQYNNSSEVVREGLRMVEERRAQQKIKLQALRQAVKLGSDALVTGDYETIHTKAELQRYVQKLGQQASSRLAKEATSAIRQRKAA